MNQEILVNITPRETRVAVLEDNVLQELHLERSAVRSMVGNIYWARVERVLPGMQAAFVDFGASRNGFLHAADVVNAKRASASPESSNLPPIKDLLREGEELLVQVSKDPLRDKGARLTAELSIASRNLVYLPHSKEIGISRLIDDSVERERLKQLLQACSPAGGYIVRTAASGVSGQDIQRDLEYLRKSWADLQDQTEREIGSCMHHDLPLSLRCLRDFSNANTTRIEYDTNEDFKNAQSFAKSYSPDLLDKIKLHNGLQGIFVERLLETEIAMSVDSRITLPCGGELVIEHTEAMTVIDVNTASFVGGQSAQQTLLQANLEAAEEIARQLRLRNIGGIVVVDFIDMDTQESRTQLLSYFQQALSRDSVKVKLGGISGFGLVELSRKRSNESVHQLAYEACSYCGGTGSQKTVSTTGIDIVREIQLEAIKFAAEAYTVTASSAVVEFLSAGEPNDISRLQDQLGCLIKLKADPYYSQSQYDIALA